MTIDLTVLEAEELHSLLSVILNDPDWFAGDSVGNRAIRRVHSKLLTKMGS